MAGLALVLAKVGFNLIASLVTEDFIKKLVLHPLQAVVKRTQSEQDDKLLKDVAEAWNVKD